jgi:hypothetical protein
MRLEFESIDEVKAFYAQLKGTRGKKGDDADEAPQTTVQVPAPIQPPTGGFNPNPAQGFNPNPAQGFTPPQTTTQASPFGGGAPAIDPAVQGLVDRIVQRTDSLLKAGQGNAEQMLTWFRGQCGPEAASATMEQIKAVFLPRLPRGPEAQSGSLEYVAKLTGA